MNKNKILIILLITFFTFGCNRNNDNENLQKYSWKEKSFFSNVAAPSDSIDKFNQDYNKDGKEIYSVIINDYSYNDFYNYIMTLENEGFNYEFVNEYIPKDISLLSDKTETSWSANNGNIYIIAIWKSKENTYYDGYNLHLLFYNYDYTISITN